MISVQRPIANPLSEHLRYEIKEGLENFYRQSEIEQRQSRAPIGKYSYLARRFFGPALQQTFNGKCAYCESMLILADYHIDKFRPQVASNTDGKGSLRHYQWLSLEWENQYLACPACNMAKRNLFPVEGERAPVGTPIEIINSKENFLLVDPCFDKPEEHLSFDASGMALPLSIKGATTIDVLNLNRPSLLAERQSVWNTVQSYARMGLYDGSLSTPTSSYSAVALAALRDLDTSKVEQSKFRHPPPRAQELSTTNLDEIRLAQRPIRKIKIRNFRILREVDFSFHSIDSSRAPCLAILGENASGKSTFLLAVSLVLAGATEASRLTQPSRVLSKGESDGYIELEFWDSLKTARLEFSRGKKSFNGTPHPSATVRAFGPLRHMERRRRQSAPSSHTHYHVKDLIAPITRIEYPTRWLISLSEEKFDAAARALKDLLPQAKDMMLVKAGNRVLFRHNGTSLPLKEASAGYQTVIGFSVEIMKLLFSFWDTLESATGVVLVDELDAHLHPLWKMRIVSALRASFPSVQFIVSTHDPLILRGMFNGEIAIMTRTDDADVHLEYNLPPIEGMQIDEILTSKAFGLDTTLAPETEALFNEYYHLLSVTRSPDVDGRIKEIRTRLGDKETLGRNARENAMLNLASKIVDENEGNGFFEADTLNEKEYELMLRIMKDAKKLPNGNN